MPTDISEKALESLIVAQLTGGGGFKPGSPADYDVKHAVDLTQFLGFIEATSPGAYAKLKLGSPGPSRDDFLSRVRGEVAKRGVVDVLRDGVKHLSEHVRLYAPRPTAGNPLAAARFAANRFTVTRQLHYSVDQSQRALDLALFVNGLPVATFELKNTLTNQSWRDGIEQYRATRSPKELLFQFKRCLVHFAVDDQQAWMCTQLRDAQSWFLPFNKGCDGGAGNPPNPDGVATDYLWREVLSRDSLCDILENYAQLVVEEDSAGKKRERLIFPRYHQLAGVRALLADARAYGVGRRYLVQHSAGSGKSNSIAWLVHQLIGLFDSVIVVTDRRVLDKQLRDNIKSFAKYDNLVGVATRAGELASFLKSGKKVITTTVQKFPFVLEEIDEKLCDRRFAIVIDEAHSSQGGSTMEKMHDVLGPPRSLDDEAGEDVDDYEDKVLTAIAKRRLLANASYFAFTATPKNKTEEMFGVPYQEGKEKKYRPFHTYSMRQAIEEGFIVDVLQHYVPVTSWYKLVKSVEDDPAYDVKKAKKKLHAYVQGNERAIATKAEIMVDHFLDEVIAAKKIGGEARAMVAASSIRRAIAYKVAFDRYLLQIGAPYKAIVAFSGEHELSPEELGREGTEKVTIDEAKLNGFASALIPERLREDPYRFLIVADKFQTGFDEPLLHTMYVDKVLSGAKAVQTLSRLNRAHPRKRDAYVLDFVNEEAEIQKAFQKYFTTTVLSGPTDPNKLHDLKSDLDGANVYAWHQVRTVVKLFLDGAPREKLDPALDLCRKAYTALSEDEQVDFKGKAKSFLRTYNFLGTVLDFAVTEWEELAVFLTLLVPKLPAPKEDDRAKGILEAVDLGSYRIEVQAKRAIQLAAEEGVVDPVPVGAGGALSDLELERLSEIVKQFNELFGNIAWKDKDRAQRLVVEEIPKKVAQDESYQNALKHSDRQNAKIEHDRALRDVITDLVTDHAELFKQFMDHADFRRWLTDHSFKASSKEGA